MDRNISWPILVLGLSVAMASNSGCNSLTFSSTASTTEGSAGASQASSDSNHSSENNSSNSSWVFADNSQVNLDGIASGVSLAEMGSKIYGIWHKRLPNSDYRIEVGVYNPNRNPNWNIVSGSNGLNLNPAHYATFGKLFVLNSRLYAFWNEAAALSGDGTSTRIRASVYNGDDSNPSWSFVDGGSNSGLNFSPSQNAFYPSAARLGSRLYLAWSEMSGSSAKIRVAIYNGDDQAPSWSFVDGGTAQGLNAMAAQGATAPQLLSFQNRLYVIWTEGPSNNGNSGQRIRVKVYNGSDASPSWNFVDGGPNGLNIDPNQQGKSPSLVVFQSKLYASWTEATGPNSALLHMKVFNGDDQAPAWSLVDGAVTGLNFNSTVGAVGGSFMEFRSKLYGFWMETPGSVYEFRVKVYNGNDSNPAWNELQPGASPLNCSDARQGSAGKLLASGDSLFAAWSEQCPSDEVIRFAQFR